MGPADPIEPNTPDCARLHIPEQDATGGGDDLPTYEDLAAQKGPNSRFGRWKGWVEKRAAERYTHLTPEERQRQRDRGWGDGVETDPKIRDFTHDRDLESAMSSTQATLPSYSRAEPQPTPLLSSSRPLPPSHLELHSFGSRFLPHTRSPIRCMLPLLGERLLLLGHDDGLSVLDMFPVSETGINGPAEAVPISIWEGEGVFQMELLEHEDIGDLAPRGVVLALVGEVDSSSPKELECTRSLRMYNLGSLTSLARWATTRKESHPLDLRRTTRWTPQQSPPKRHKQHPSIAKGLKAFLNDSQQQDPGDDVDSCHGYVPMLNSVPSEDSLRASTLERVCSDASGLSSWDVIDDFPLRWAADFVPLPVGVSRPTSSSVLFFELKKDEHRGRHGSALLAVAIRSCILLYETPKGERAFRFVKEFYTPSPARNITFVYQKPVNPSLPQNVARELNYSIKSRHITSRSSLDSPHRHVPSTSSDYGDQLSLFVVFDGRAGIIRVADSHVSEVEVFSDSSKDLLLPYGTFPRKYRSSGEHVSPTKEKEGKHRWLPPRLSILRLQSQNGSTWKSYPVYILTKGTRSFILSYPLLLPLCCQLPLITLTWESTPTHVSHRTCYPSEQEPFLQLVALGEFGIEIQEIPFPLPGTKSKMQRRWIDPVRFQIDVGDTGFLRDGGKWDQVPEYLSRSDSLLTMNNDVQALPSEVDQGIYAWCHKGLEDWRLFWLGGLNTPSTDSDEDTDI